jgi:glycopeptide antibiotics resistance protein
MPSWVLYSLPDGLWVYSFSAMLYIIWKESIIRNKVIIMPFLILLTSEMLQYLKIINGTFDISDIFISFIMSVLLIINLKLYKNEESN